MSLCGAGLVTLKHAITAAHCVDKVNVTYSVLAGTDVNEMAQDNGIMIEVHVC